MDSKILNFVDAMKLAKIVSKYFTVEQIGGMIADDFEIELFSQLSEQEILDISGFLLGDTSKLKPREIMQYCVEEMIKNNLLELLSTYKQIGFK